MVLGTVFVLLAVLVAAATPLAVRYAEARQRGAAPELRLFGPRGKRGEEVSLRELWEVEAVRDGVIHVRGGLRAVLSLGAVDYSLMSPEARMSVVSALTGAVMSLSSPVQVFATAEGVDAASYVSEIQSFLRGAPENLAGYGARLASCLAELARDRSVQVHRRYLVLTAEGDPEAARRELDRQASVISSVLAAAGMGVKRLATEEVLDLLNHVFNRYEPVRPSELVRSGGLYFFKEGVTAHAEPAREEETAPTA